MDGTAYFKYITIVTYSQSISCKMLTAAQPYTGAWYRPMQHSTALHHWALHHTHYIWPKCWWLMLGKP